MKNNYKLRFNISEISIILFVILIINLVYFYFNLPRLGEDSSRYIYAAEALLSGQPLEPRAQSYFGYIFFIAIAKILGLNNSGIVFLQILLFCVATYYLYLIGILIDSKKVGLLAAIIYGFNLDLIKWNLYILTETLYISLVIITIYYFLLLLNDQRTLKNYFFLIGLAILLLVTRPNGLVIVPILSIYLAVRMYGFLKIIMISSAIFLICLLSFLFYFQNYFNVLQDVAPINSIYNGVIIWGYSNWNLTMPIHSTTESSIFSFFIYLFTNLPYILELFFYRVIIELGHIRPFYSFLHNIVVGGSLLIIYTLAIYGYINRIKSVNTEFINLYIFINIIIIAFTYSDWDGRFLNYFLPFIFLYSSIGLKYLIKFK
jgi:hypothetical protein